MKTSVLIILLIILFSTSALGQFDRNTEYRLKTYSKERAFEELNQLLSNSDDKTESIRLKVLQAKLLVTYGEFDQADSLLSANHHEINDLNEGVSVLLAENHLVRAYLYQLLEYWSKFKENIDASIRIKKRLGTDDFVEEYVMLPWYYQSTQVFDSAYYYGQKAIQIAKSTIREDKVYLLARAYNNHGYTFHYDPSMRKNNEPFYSFMDSANTVIKKQNYKDYLTQARIYHNIGNHKSFNSGMTDTKIISVADSYHKKSYELYLPYDNPYFLALNNFVRGYNYFFHSQYAQAADEPTRLNLEKSIEYFVQGAKILIEDNDFDESNPPKSFDNKIDNLFLILINRIVLAYEALSYHFDDPKYLDSEIQFRSYYLDYYLNLLGKSIYQNDDLKFMSSYYNPFSQAYLWKTYKIYEEDGDKDKLIDAYVKASLAKNYLSYVHLAKMLNLDLESFTINTIRKNVLIQNTAIVEFFTVEEGNIVAVITKEEVSFFFFKDFGLYKYPDLVKQLRSENLSEFSQASNGLYNKLLRPALDKLPSHIENLLIVPDIGTDQVPFEALVTKIDGDNRFLIEDFNIKYAMSLPLEMQGKARNFKKGEALFTAPLGMESTLAFSNVLINDLSSTYSSQEVVRSMNKKELISHLESSLFAHISSHMTNGKTSFDGQIQLKNDTLKQRDISELDLSKLQLAILHGCKSSISTVNANGFTGLGREFMKQGAGAVIQSLWDIDDRFSSDLLKVFYRNLEDGLKPSNALREAKLEMLNNKEVSDYALPWNWSGLVFYGYDQPIELVTKRDYSSLYYLSCLFLLLVGGVIYRKKYSKL